ncbi:unnamed protein product [Moneuplotes crassus]|uniref:Uncharacterized protein n=1 Tax=Euplotes crassus TaxID=5936 RepID=A0AAD1U6K6_EUPCR|nr:unnamed protein product [Moneuplotes crassus]
MSAYNTETIDSCMINIKTIPSKCPKKIALNKLEPKTNKSRNFIKKHNTTTGAKTNIKGREPGVYNAFISRKSFRNNKVSNTKSVYKKEKSSEKPVTQPKASSKCSLNHKINKNTLYRKTFRTKISPKQGYSRNISKPKYLATQPINCYSIKLPTNTDHIKKKRGSSKPKTNYNQGNKWCSSFTYTMRESNKFKFARSPQNKPKRPIVCSKSPNVSHRMKVAKPGKLPSCKKRKEEIKTKCSPKQKAKKLVPQSYRSNIVPAPRICKKLISKRENPKRLGKRSPPAIPKRSIKLNLANISTNKFPSKQPEVKMEKYSKYIIKKEAQEINKHAENQPEGNQNTISNVNISIEDLECITTSEGDKIRSSKEVPEIVSKEIFLSKETDPPMRIYDMPEDLESEVSSFKGCISPDKLFADPDESQENTVERRIEILELHDLLLDELCVNQEEKLNQKVSQIELLDDPSEAHKEEETKKALKNNPQDQQDRELNERGTMSENSNPEDNGETTVVNCTSQAGAFSQINTDRVD